MTSEPLSDDWITAYKEFGSPKHLHALGVIAATYNVMEFQLSHWFRASIDANYEDEIPAHIFAALSNNTRLDIIRKFFSKPKFEEFQKYIDSALKSYSICSENRNILMHSFGFENFVDQDLCNFLKPSRDNPKRVVDYPLRVSDLREVANDIRGTASYLECVLSFVVSDVPLPHDEFGVEIELSTLLGIFPLPRKLSLICREALQDARLLHQPWDGSQDGLEDPD